MHTEMNIPALGPQTLPADAAAARCAGTLCVCTHRQFVSVPALCVVCPLTISPAPLGTTVASCVGGLPHLLTAKINARSQSHTRCVSRWLGPPSTGRGRAWSAGIARSLRPGLQLPVCNSQEGRRPLGAPAPGCPCPRWCPCHPLCTRTGPGGGSHSGVPSAFAESRPDPTGLLQAGSYQLLALLSPPQ